MTIIKYHNTTTTSTRQRRLSRSQTNVQGNINFVTPKGIIVRIVVSTVSIYLVLSSFVSPSKCPRQSNYTRQKQPRQAKTVTVQIPYICQNNHTTSHNFIPLIITAGFHQPLDGNYPLKMPTMQHEDLRSSLSNCKRGLNSGTSKGQELAAAHLPSMLKTGSDMLQVNWIKGSTRGLRTQHQIANSATSGHTSLFSSMPFFRVKGQTMVYVKPKSHKKLDKF